MICRPAAIVVCTLTWADPNPVPPWEWRATAKDRKAQPAGR
jgi:hypothetical protein